MSEKVKISVIGATGYTGLELIRLLSLHPRIELNYLISKNHPGEKVSGLYPHLQNCCDLSFSSFDEIEVAAEESDLVFLALPHLQSFEIVKKIISKTKIVDLSADFRIKDMGLFEKYYSSKHAFEGGLKDFVYGLSEANKDSIEKSNNVANPGCFASVCQLALLPLKDKIENVEVFAVTGSSGAGKQVGEGTHHPIRNHNIKSYKVGVHQHTPEIIETLDIKENQFTFVPASGPFTRGIYLTAFVSLKEIGDLDYPTLYKEFYNDSPFVRVKNEVQLAEVVASNFCDVSVNIVNGKLVICAVIDNLVKGAAGNAVQNMNILLGFDQALGLSNLSPLFP